MPFLVGLGLALAISAMATFVGFDRERSFYPTVTIVIASYYAYDVTAGGYLAVLLARRRGEGRSLVR